MIDLCLLCGARPHVSRQSLRREPKLIGSSSETIPSVVRMLMPGTHRRQGTVVPKCPATVAQGCLTKAERNGPTRQIARQPSCLNGLRQLADRRIPIINSGSSLMIPLIPADQSDRAALGALIVHT